MPGGPGKISSFNDSTTALGPSAQTTPGIAYPSDQTLGGYWLFHMPNGRALVLRQIDYGPAAWTGRKYDFSAPAVRAAGYSMGNFPTDAVAHGTYLGKSVPAQYQHLVIGQGGSAAQGMPGGGGPSPQAPQAPQAAQGQPQGSPGIPQALLANLIQSSSSLFPTVPHELPSSNLLLGLMGSGQAAPTAPARPPARGKK